MFRIMVRGFGPVKTLARTYGRSADDFSCRVLVVGGGSGGCTVAAKLVAELGSGKVVILEPADCHFYQPLFTLVGGGITTVQDATRRMAEVLPQNARWIQDGAASFVPEKNLVKTVGGKSIKYDYLVIALGLSVDVDKIEGLQQALEDPLSGVCTNYLPAYAPKTFQCLKDFKQGTVLFTCPSTPIKCGGAPQKIAYLAEDYFKKHDKRRGANMVYKTGQAVFFPSPHFEAALLGVCKDRDIDVSRNIDLVKVDSKAKKATFRDTGSGEDQVIEYAFLHATPPQSAPKILKSAPKLVDAAGWLAVDKNTLQHTTYSNIFGIGDCTNLPTSKTAAAIAAQSKVVVNNLLSVKKKNPPTTKYDGYTSCPLVTGYNSLILAEFDYDKKPLETFPVDQRKESAFFYRFSKDVLPAMYWSLMLKGHWHGPELVRKFFHPFSKSK